MTAAGERQELHLADVNPGFYHRDHRGHARQSDTSWIAYASDDATWIEVARIARATAPTGCASAGF